VEAVQVHALRVHDGLVPRRLPNDRRLVRPGQGPPQQRHVRAHRAVRVGRHPVGAPDPFHQLVDRDHPVRLREQHREHAALAGVADVDEAVPGLHLHWSEQPELRCRAHIATVPTD
jgi:hypothetical protein